MQPNDNAETHQPVRPNGRYFIVSSLRINGSEFALATTAIRHLLERFANGRRFEYNPARRCARPEYAHSTKLRRPGNPEFLNCTAGAGCDAAIAVAAGPFRRRDIGRAAKRATGLRVASVAQDRME
jgi:hypothetical protein